MFEMLLSHAQRATSISRFDRSNWFFCIIAQIGPTLQRWFIQIRQPRNPLACFRGHHHVVLFSPLHPIFLLPANQPGCLLYPLQKRLRIHPLFPPNQQIQKVLLMLKSLDKNPQSVKFQRDCLKSIWSTKRAKGSASARRARFQPRLCLKSSNSAVIRSFKRLW